MPISHPLKTIFVHIPKTAGTSIEKALGICGVDNRGSNEVCYPILFGNDGKRFLQHLFASEIAELVGPTMFTSYFKFAVVRNPFARVLSAYLGYYHKECTDFDRFVGKVLPKVVALPPAKDHARHLKPQVSFVFDEHGTQFVDFIARQESLSRDMQMLGDRIGAPISLGKPRAVRSEDYHSKFNAASRRIIENEYKDDFEAFGYAF